MKKIANSMKAVMLGCTFFFALLGCKKEAETINISDEEAIMTASQTNSSEQIPAVPQNLRLDPTYKQTPFSAQFIWDAPSPPEVSVIVYSSSFRPGEAWAADYWGYGRWAYTLNNLQQNSTYSVSVQAANSSGIRSPISDPFTFKTPPTNDRTPPTAPSNLVLTFDAYTIFVKWNASSDNYDPASEITYGIYDVQSGQLACEVKGKTTLDVTNGGRFINLCSTYVVKARDRSGNLSSPSNPARTTFTGCQ